MLSPGNAAVKCARGAGLSAGDRFETANGPLLKTTVFNRREIGYKVGMKCFRSISRLSFFAAVAATAVSASLSLRGADETEPRVINPGPPPSDAIVLFDGKDHSAWRSGKGGPVQWNLVDGAMQVNGTGGIFTKEEFGDIQLHVEWASPSEVKGNSQGRGNSGVYLQGRYEIQVLDSYENKTSFKGQAGALYGYFPPLVNASRRPGEWQTYDIIFHAATSDADGKLIPGSMTVLHNGVLIQDHVAVTNSTTASPLRGPSKKGPLYLQDHGNPVRYRNIWVRPLTH